MTRNIAIWLRVWCVNYSLFVFREIKLICKIPGQHKGKGKGQPTTGHEDPEGECKYSSIIYLASAVDGSG